MIKPNRIAIKILIIASMLCLAACDTPFINPPKPAVYSRQAGIGAGVGASTGLLAGAAAGSIPAGIGIGALLGFGAGAYAASSWHQVKELASQGVQVVQIGDVGHIIIPADKLFEFDSATIIPQSYPILYHVATFLERYGNVPVTVTGYADNIGPHRRSLNLAMHRAQSIVAFLWSRGIPFNNLHAQSRGQANPVASNGNPLGSYNNRRVVLSYPVVHIHNKAAPLA